LISDIEKFYIHTFLKMPAKVQISYGQTTVTVTFRTGDLNP